MRRGWWGALVLLHALATAPPAFAAGDASTQRLHALFFGEIDYREREDVGNDGFVIGQAVGQVNLLVDERLSVFSEVTATARRGSDYEFEIERLFVRYDFSDQYKLSAGRYHTPLGYWNAAFHHGSWLQTTVSRPETAKFGSNVIPIHFVGGLLEGRMRDTNFSYRLGLGNGRSEDINDPGDFGDNNSQRAWLLGGSYRAGPPFRWEAGVSAYFDEPRTPGGVQVDEQLYNAYLAVLEETPEVIVEYAHGRHDGGGEDGNVDSLYAQVAWRLGDGGSRFKPYLRAEQLDVDNDDPLLGALGLDYDGITGGVRWDFSPLAVLKAEVRSEKFDSGDRRAGVWLQLAFVFDATSRHAIASTAPADHSRSAQSRRRTLVTR